MDLSALTESLWQDVRYGARLLRTDKGFFAVATLSLALGIGANTAIFQLLDAVRLRTLPIRHAEELAELSIAKNEHCCSGNFSDRWPNFTFPQWEQIRDRQQAFSHIFAWGDYRFNLAQSGEVRFAEGLWVTGDFFKTLGVTPLLGRLISADDDRPGCASPGVVISHSFWQRQYGGDSEVIGKQVSLEGHRLDIAGVTPANFFGVEVGRNFDLAVPTCAEPLIEGERSHLAKRDHWWLAIIGRLKPGFTAKRATAQAAAMSPAVFSSTIPPHFRPQDVKYYANYKLTVDPAGSGVSSLRKTYQEPLLLLLGIAGLVLLIACSNLANLMLARASTREREMAVRLALGANRGRLIRQLLAESLLLTLIGTAAGALLAQLLSRDLVAFISTRDNPLFVDLVPDWRVLAFTATVAIVTCILSGLTPALRATRTDSASAMKSAGRGMTADRERFGVRRLLVISQVALSLVLLFGALLFVRSFRNLLTTEAGFNERGLIVTSLDVSRLNIPVGRRTLLYRQIVDNVRAVAGVERAASAVIVPISGDGWNQLIKIVGYQNEKERIPFFNRVSNDYFRTLGTQFIAGRDFDDRDTLAAPDVAIVNKEFSRKFLNGDNSIGKQFRLMGGPDEPQRVFQIVGLVKDSKYRDLRGEFEPLVYLAAAQDKEPGLGLNILVRSAAPLGTLMPELKKAVMQQNAGISLDFQIFETQIRESLLREQLMASLSGFFGFVAAVLATIGLYGVISYMVARRRSEIGLRIALGATRGGIIGLVVKEAGLLLIIGVAVGTALAIATGRAASSLLYGLKPADPATVVFAIVLLASVGLAASLLPALRASRVEPMTALREE